MPQGDYKPKFKLGQTVICINNDRAMEGVEFIVVFTYLSIREYASFYANRICPPEYNESDEHSVIYSVLERQGEGGGKYTQYTWFTEPNLALFCSNVARGKKILLEPKHIQLLKDSYAISDDSLEKLKTILTLPEP